ncbi:hypothetical protein NX059_000743 [Plenodomus lindquistii]|nr:hypothetical protein NX059_000743 [Plenodomus lindquistii]
MLNEDCPDALDAFPNPEAFKFQTIGDKTYVHVGHGYDGKRKASGIAWVKNVGSCKPWLKVSRITDGYVEDDNYRYVRCHSAFALAAGSDDVYAWHDRMKALVSFVLVYAGHQEIFADFDRGEGYPLLKSILEAGLRRGQKKQSEESSPRLAAMISDQNSTTGPSSSIEPSSSPQPSSTQHTESSDTPNSTHVCEDISTSNTSSMPCSAENSTCLSEMDTDEEHHQDNSTSTKRKRGPDIDMADAIAKRKKKARSE